MVKAKSRRPKADQTVTKRGKWLWAWRSCVEAVTGFTGLDIQPNECRRVRFSVEVA